ncbi:hypothetical protein SETIT_9G363800v2 [Setaria italica]|uniref:Uncharacterized protein n=1 Tax=Setaria italica TaxID=4555 RepID=A0A368SPK2_SETIT|nr:hypothetical protein SETIT_9G363800v2 [Setaria italica]
MTASGRYRWPVDPDSQGGGRSSTGWRVEVPGVRPTWRTFLAVQKEMRKGLDSLIILVTWEIWKHKNDCVFEKVRPTIQEVLRAISNEGGLWCMAGASRLQELLSRSPPLGV